MTKYNRYETVIGLEIHIQLSTRSKAFCGDDAAFGGLPNTHVSAISLGHPGTLPRLNKQEIACAVKLGLALGSHISPVSYFDRKNYFYTDLPKGYQITQDRLPICVGGELQFEVDGNQKKVRIHHIHMEEDAGKSIHDLDPQHSLVDLNRAGVPLLEVVSEPDLHSPEEVDVFMMAIRQLVRYLGISDGNMQEGSMRCDCNVSVRLKGETKLNERCEIKNLNSMRYARRAIEYEFKRQVELLESGGKVLQQTLNFDPATGVTTPLRDKENAHDYRYFPEPDLAPVVLSETFIEELKQTLPPLPKELYEQFVSEFQLSEYDANLLTEEKQTALFFIKLAEQTPHFKAAANLIINKINPYLNEEKISLPEFPVPPKRLAEFIELIESGKVSNTVAYQRLFPLLVEQPSKTPLEIAESLNLIQSADENFLEELIEASLAENAEKVSAYRNGKRGLLGFFMGDIMRKSKGKADPKATNALLKEKLEE